MKHADIQMNLEKFSFKHFNFLSREKIERLISVTAGEKSEIVVKIVGNVIKR